MNKMFNKLWNKIKGENTAGMSAKPMNQRELLDYWLPFLAKIREIELVWLEGSLANSDRDNPASDINIRFAIADASYDKLWESNRKKIFKPLGNVLPIERFSVVTEHGILIEFFAYKTSEVIGKEIFEWEFLLNRLPEGQPNFISAPGWEPNVKWSHNDKVAFSDVLDVSTTQLLRRLSLASTPFYYEDAHSAHRTLEVLKTSLLRILYYREGVRPYARANHLEQVLSPEALEQYEYVQFQKHEYAFDHSAIARATLRTFNMLIKNVKDMYEQAGMEAPDKWIQIAYQKAEKELNKFI